MTEVKSDIVTVQENEIRNLDMIAAEINGTMTAVRKFNLQVIADIGEKLIEARNMVPHGGWLTWLENNVHFTDQTARRYMDWAEEYGRISKSNIVSDMSFIDALNLIALPEAVQSEIIDGYNTGRVDAEDISDEIAQMKERIKELEKANEQLGFDLGDATQSAKERLHSISELEAEKTKLTENMKSTIDAEVQRCLEDNDAENKLKKAKQELSELKVEAQEAKALADEADAARRKALSEVAISGNEDKVKFRCAIDDLQTEYNKAVGIYANLSADEKDKMREALRYVLEQMLNGLK